MKTSTALSLLLAASPAVGIAAPGYAEEAAQTSDQIAELDGGYQEWTTDQDISDEAVKDEDLKRKEKQAEDEGICIPIGEGENCW